MGKTIQKIEDVKSKGRISQKSDAAETEQIVKGADAKDVQQSVASQQEELHAGKFRAKGHLAIVGLVLLLICYALFQYLSK